MDQLRITLKLISRGRVMIQHDFVIVFERMMRSGIRESDLNIAIPDDGLATTTDSVTTSATTAESTTVCRGRNCPQGIQGGFLNVVRMGIMKALEFTIFAIFS